MGFAAPLLGAKAERTPVAVPGRDRARGMERRRFSGSTDGQLFSGYTYRSKIWQRQGRLTKDADILDLLGPVGEAACQREAGIPGGRCLLEGVDHVARELCSGRQTANQDRFGHAS